MEPLYIIIGIIIIYLIINKIAEIIITNSKEDVINDLKKYFNARKSLQDYWKIDFNGKNILVFYDTEINPEKISEYVIAYIETDAATKSILEKCPLNLDFTNINFKPYIVIYATWGYRGEKFKMRLENKLLEIEKCLKLAENQDNISDNHT